MILVYLSVALILISVGYLGYSAFKTFKRAKPSINSLAQTVASVQRQTDQIKEQTTELTLHQQQIAADINQKKADVHSTILVAKQTFTSFKGLWKVRPISFVKGKSLKFKKRRRSLQTY